MNVNVSTKEKPERKRKGVPLGKKGGGAGKRSASRPNAVVVVAGSGKLPRVARGGGQAVASAQLVSKEHKKEMHALQQLQQQVARISRVVSGVKPGNAAHPARVPAPRSVRGAPKTGFNFDRATYTSGNYLSPGDSLEFKNQEAFTMASALASLNDAKTAPIASGNFAPATVFEQNVTTSDTISLAAGDALVCCLTPHNVFIDMSNNPAPCPVSYFSGDLTKDLNVACFNGITNSAYPKNLTAGYGGTNELPCQFAVLKSSMGVKVLASSALATAPVIKAFGPREVGSVPNPETQTLAQPLVPAVWSWANQGPVWKQNTSGFISGLPPELALGMNSPVPGNLTPGLDFSAISPPTDPGIYSVGPVNTIALTAGSGTANPVADFQTSFVPNNPANAAVVRYAPALCPGPGNIFINPQPWSYNVGGGGTYYVGATQFESSVSFNGVNGVPSYPVAAFTGFGNTSAGTNFPTGGIWPAGVGNPGITCTCPTIIVTNNTSSVMTVQCTSSTVYAIKPSAQYDYMLGNLASYTHRSSVYRLEPGMLYGLAAGGFGLDLTDPNHAAKKAIAMSMKNAFSTFTRSPASYGAIMAALSTCPNTANLFSTGRASAGGSMLGIRAKGDSVQIVSGLVHSQAASTSKTPAEQLENKIALAADRKASEIPAFNAADQPVLNAVRNMAISAGSGMARHAASRIFTPENGDKWGRALASQLFSMMTPSGGPKITSADSSWDTLLLEDAAAPIVEEA